MLQHMKVKIGNIEITVETPDELDELVKRYGGTTAIEPDDAKHQKHHKGGQSANTPADMVVLKKFVDGASQGVTTTELGEILGRRGKATRHAVRDWAKRIGLTSDDNSFDPFEESRVGTQRGLRIKPSLLEVAKTLMRQH
jgi:hypothetical protein